MNKVSILKLLSHADQVIQVKTVEPSNGYKQLKLQVTLFLRYHLGNFFIVQLIKRQGWSQMPGFEAQMSTSYNVKWGHTL